jgi:hypothetical protein
MYTLFLNAYAPLQIPPTDLLPGYTALAEVATLASPARARALVAAAQLQVSGALPPSRPPQSSLFPYTLSHTTRNFSTHFYSNT